MTNIQILQQSVLLKYTGLYKFLQDHAPEVSVEIKEAYATTMSSIYLRHFKGYLGDLMRLRTEVATKGDLLGQEEWTSFSASSLFSNKLSAKPTTARGDGAFKLGERTSAVDVVSEPPLIPAVLQQSGQNLHYEAIFGAVSSLLLDTVGCEYDFMTQFFGAIEAFENIFGKSIFHVMEYAALGHPSATQSSISPPTQKPRAVARHLLGRHRLLAAPSGPHDLPYEGFSFSHALSFIVL